MRFPRQVAVILRHPAFHAAPVAAAERLNKHLPLAAQIIGVRAIVPVKIVRRRIEHFTRIGQQHADQRDRVAAIPSADAVGVHGLEIGKRFRAGNPRRQQQARKSRP